MRLDRYDSYIRNFHAVVTAVRPADSSDGQGDRKAWVALDRSAFYPTAGGQEHDVGTITTVGRLTASSARVTDVTTEGGTVWHLLNLEGDGGVATVGATVFCELDWEHRYVRMQRHTGQHVLSQALLRVDPSFVTLSVSMRGPDCTVDFAGQADAGQLAAVEREANRAARQAAPVMTFEVDDSVLCEYHLRRPPKVSGKVRLVAVGSYDLAACGGTHVRNSAEVLPIKLLRAEHGKGDSTRLTFRVGQEAREDHDLKHDVTSALGAALSVPVDGLAERVQALQDELAATTAGLADARRALAARAADGLVAAAAGGVVVAYLGGDEAQLMPQLVDELQRRPGVVALLAAPDGAAGAGTAVGAAGLTRFAFVAGDGSGVDVRPALTATLAELGGRGGGRPDRAQGAATTTREEAEAALAVGRGVLTP